MKYRNASDILPDELLKELQKYVSGETLYIPSGVERQKWGHGSGARVFYKERNEEIRSKYFHKTSIEDLAEAYFLSTETIRKILYK
jgi:Mor family transcriptional regulator